jgi:hypothetical protein
MHVFRLYLFDVLVFVVSYAAAFGLLTAILLFGARGCSRLPFEQHVRSGPWLCENAAARKIDRTTVFSDRH